MLDVDVEIGLGSWSRCWSRRRRYVDVAVLDWALAVEAVGYVEVDAEGSRGGWLCMLKSEVVAPDMAVPFA